MIEKDGRKFGATAKFNFDLDKKLALQVIPKEVKDLGIQEAVKFVCKDFSTTSDFSRIGGINTININIQNEQQGEKILEAISKWIVHNFDTLLEEETGIDRGKFYRSTTFFEASVQNEYINIQWS